MAKIAQCEPGLRYSVHVASVIFLQKGAKLSSELFFVCAFIHRGTLHNWMRFWSLTDLSHWSLFIMNSGSCSMTSVRKGRRRTSQLGNRHYLITCLLCWCIYFFVIWMFWKFVCDFYTKNTWFKSSTVVLDRYLVVIALTDINIVQTIGLL